MRISCVLGPYLPVPPLLGGAVERIWYSLCQEFARLGHDVTLISRQYQNLRNDEMAAGVRYLRIPSTDAPVSKALYRLYDLRYAIRACKALPASDITITNSVSLPLLLNRSKAGRIYVSVARFPKGQMGLYRRADRLQAVSRAVATAIGEQSPNVANRTKVVPNALGEAFTRLRHDSRGTRSREILYVGRIAQEKGLELLVRAFRSIPERDDWSLALVGPSDPSQGGDGTAFAEQLRTLAGDARVRIEPPVFDEMKLIERMQRADIFVYPSIADQGESFGLAPLEAMSCGCAVLVSSLACFRDFLDHGENGVIFDQRDATGSALALALGRLMRSPDDRNRIGTAAISKAKTFDVQVVAQLYVDDFASLLATQTA